MTALCRATRSVYIYIFHIRTLILHACTYCQSWDTPKMLYWQEAKAQRSNNTTLAGIPYVTLLIQHRRGRSTADQPALTHRNFIFLSNINVRFLHNSRPPLRRVTHTIIALKDNVRWVHIFHFPCTIALFRSCAGGYNLEFGTHL